MMRHRLATLLLVALVAASPAAAQQRVTLSLNGAYDVSSLSFAQTVAITEFVEQGSLRSSYTADPGPGFDVGLQVRLIGGLALTAAFSQVNRSIGGDVAATIPHPLYFDRPRSADRGLDGLDYTERAAHVGAGWQAGAGAARITVFGGLSLFRVSADLVNGVDFSQSYPYDSVTLDALRSQKAEESPTGFHVGGRLDLALGERFGVGAQLRFSRATARLSVADSPVEIDAGGLQAAAGLRFFF